MAIKLNLKTRTNAGMATSLLLGLCGKGAIDGDQTEALN